MRKCDDEIYQLAKDQARVKKLKNKRFKPFCLCLPGVMFVTRIKEEHFSFRHFVCEFYRRMDTVGMFQIFIKLFIAMCPLHVNVIYKSEPWKKLFKWREE